MVIAGLLTSCCSGYKCSHQDCEVECQTWTAMRKHVASHTKGEGEGPGYAGRGPR